MDPLTTLLVIFDSALALGLGLLLVTKPSRTEKMSVQIKAGQKNNTLIPLPVQEEIDKMIRKRTDTIDLKARALSRRVDAVTTRLNTLEEKLTQEIEEIKAIVAPKDDLEKDLHTLKIKLKE